MKKTYYHKRILSKAVDGCWDWEVLVWLKNGLFADLTIGSPQIRAFGKFTTKEAAQADMKKTLELIGLPLVDFPKRA